MREHFREKDFVKGWEMWHYFRIDVYSKGKREENCSNHFKHSRHFCILARLKCLKSIVWEPLLFSYTQNGMVTCLLVSQII